MSEPILILGKSGSGKSYLCRNLKPESTLLCSVDQKRPPFSLNGWDRMGSACPSGSYYPVPRDNSYPKLRAAITAAVGNGKTIVVIDDSQYLLAHEFFAKSLDRGYEKFSVMGKNFWDFIDFSRSMQDDVVVYFLHHVDHDEIGQIKAKTIGKLLDEKGCLEGRFTVCLLAEKTEDGHALHSNLPGQAAIKAPPKMFLKNPLVNEECDLANVDTDIRAYWGLE